MSHKRFMASDVYRKLDENVEKSKPRGDKFMSQTQGNFTVFF